MTASGETLYTTRTPYPDVLQRERTNAVQFPVYRDGALVAPSSGTFSLLDPAGVALVDGAAVTVTGDIATYSVTAAVLSSSVVLGDGYQEVWALVMPDGTTRTWDREAAVARRPLAPVVTDADLEGAYPDLPATRGTSISSLQGFLDEAWKQIIGRLISEGVLPYLVKSGWSFRTAHIELTLAMFYRWLAKNQGARGNYLELAEHHRRTYEKAWTQINFTVDADHDGRVDDAEQRTASGIVVHTASAPQRRLRRDPRW